MENTVGSPDQSVGIDNESIHKKIGKTQTNSNNSGSTRIASDILPRPSNLTDLCQNENLTYDKTEANFSLSDIDEHEEIWVIDVPKTVNPQSLKGQGIRLGKKNKFQIGDQWYQTFVTSQSTQNLSLVVNTSKRTRCYKTVNIRTAGSIRVRQKLKNITDINLETAKKQTVPLPRNLKLRHPLLGV